MPAAKQILAIDQGADFEQEFQWRDDDDDPVTLTGVYTAEAEIRERYDDVDAALTFMLELEPNDLGEGWIRIKAADTETAGLDFTKGHWDLLLTEIASGDKDRLLEGVVEISPQVTR